MALLEQVREANDDGTLNGLPTHTICKIFGASSHEGPAALRFRGRDRGGDMTCGKAPALAVRLMSQFATRTGVHRPAHNQQRYLWTDAFAVCNFLTLFKRTRDQDDLRCARALIESVHRVLGRFRDDDARRGWIGGLDEESGRSHPTAGGLRIGKRLRERQPGEPFDERLEWDRDGQYFHYLTKMDARALPGGVRCRRP